MPISVSRAATVPISPSLDATVPKLFVGLICPATVFTLVMFVATVRHFHLLRNISQNIRRYFPQFRQFLWPSPLQIQCACINASAAYRMSLRRILAATVNIAINFTGPVLRCVLMLVHLTMQTRSCFCSRNNNRRSPDNNILVTNN